MAKSSDIALAERKLAADCEAYIPPAQLGVRAVGLVLQIHDDPEKRADLFATCLANWLHGWNAVLRTMQACVIISESNR